MALNIKKLETPDHPTYQIIPRSDIKQVTAADDRPSEYSENAKEHKAKERQSLVMNALRQLWLIG